MPPDRKASKSETECNRDYVKVSQSKHDAPPPCGVCGLARPDADRYDEDAGRPPAGAPFPEEVDLIKHLSAAPVVRKAFLLEIAESTSGERWRRFLGDCLL